MSGQALRIVRLANFVAPSSGGLRTALRELGKGYAAAGHEPVLVVPGEGLTDRLTEQGRVITLPGPVVPGSGGYRVLTDRRRVAALLAALRPDRLEVSDRTTLRWTGRWARRARVPAVMVSHESTDGVLRAWGLSEPLSRRAADALNTRTAHAFARVVCTTGFAEREFVRIGARNVVRAPLGVDLVERRPELRDTELRARYARGSETLLVMCSRLSVEKRPGTALDALEALLRRGRAAVLVVAGDGPLRARLEHRARERRLPVTFLGHVPDRRLLGALQASADVSLAPGPVETFGLAALEALACGTSVVASASSALGEVIGTAGATAADHGDAFAEAVLHVLARPEPLRRRSARARAERFDWNDAVAAFLTAHDAAVTVPAGPGGLPGDENSPAAHAPGRPPHGTLQPVRADRAARTVRAPHTVPAVRAGRAAPAAVAEVAAAPVRGAGHAGHAAALGADGPVAVPSPGSGRAQCALASAEPVVSAGESAVAAPRCGPGHADAAVPAPGAVPAAAWPHAGAAADLPVSAEASVVSSYRPGHPDSGSVDVAGVDVGVPARAGGGVPAGRAAGELPVPAKAPPTGPGHAPPGAVDAAGVPAAVSSQVGRVPAAVSSRGGGVPADLAVPVESSAPAAARPPAGATASRGAVDADGTAVASRLGEGAA